MNGLTINLNKPSSCRNCGLRHLFWDKWEKRDGTICSRQFNAAGELHSCGGPPRPKVTQQEALASAGSGKEYNTRDFADGDGPPAPPRPVVPINLVPSSYPQLWAQYQELKRLFEGVPGV